MRIQLTTTQASGKADVVAQRYQAGQPIHIAAAPGSSVALEIDGQPITGKSSVQGKRPALLRRDDDLVVMLDGDALAVVEEFFVSPDTGLQGSDWLLAQAGGDAGYVASDAAPTATEAAASSSGGGANNALYWALGAAGLAGVVAAASGSGSSGGSGGGSVGGATNAQAPSSIKVSGQVVAGPVIENHGLQVNLYKADGTVLAEAVKVDANGKFHAEYDSSYKGVVIAKVVDTTPGKDDYHDEASNAPKGLDTNLRAVFANPASGVIDVVLSPLSELVTRNLGLASGVTVASTLTEKQLADTSQQIAQKLGLDSGVFSKVIPVVDAEGKPIAAPNSAGLVLMALSGLEQLHGVNGSMDLLLKAIAASGNNEMSALLIAGSREAGQIPNRDFIDLWTKVAPDSGMATAVTTAAKLSADTIKAWSAADVKALGPEIVAALTPEQMALMPAAAVAGLSAAQLQVLDSASMQPLMPVLTVDQLKALSPVALAVGMGLHQLAIAVTDDSAGGSGVTVTQANQQAFTKDTTPKLSGMLASKLPTGAELILFNGKAQLGKATIESDRQTWSFTPTTAWADGRYEITASVSLPGGTMSSPSIPLQLTTDTAAPSVVITADKPLLSAGETATIIFTFSEALLSAPQGNQLTVINGTLGPLTQDAKWPNVYTALFTPSANVTGALASISVNTYSDKAGNVGAKAVFDYGLTVDTVAPTVAKVEIAGHNPEGLVKTSTLIIGDKIRVSLTMSENCKISEEASYTITFGDLIRQAKYLSGNGSNTLVFEYLVQPGDVAKEGVGVTADVHALSLSGTLSDMAGNAVGSTMPKVEGNANTIAVDAIAPVMKLLSVAAVGSNGQKIAEDTPARIGDKLEFTVGFDKAPAVTEKPELAFVWGEQEKKAVYDRIDGNNVIFCYEVQGDDYIVGKPVEVTVQTALQTTDDATITDISGNAFVVPETLQFTPETVKPDAVLVDGRQAKITSIEIVEVGGAMDGWLKRDSTVKFRVTLDKEVELGGQQPELSVLFGEEKKAIAYTGNMSGRARTLDFDYTLGRNDVGLDGIAIPVNALQAKGGTFTENNNPANLTNAAIEANSTYRVDGRDVVITAMAVTGMAADGAIKTGALTTGDKIRIKVDTSDAVTVAGVPIVNLTVNNVAKMAIYVPDASEGNRLVFDYTLVQGENLNNAFNIVANALTLTQDQTIQNVAGTALTTVMPIVEAQTGLLKLTDLTADKFVISTDLIKAAGVDGAYGIVLNQRDSIISPDMGAAQYGFWTFEGNVFHRRWTTTTEDKQEFTLYVNGGDGPLAYSAAVIEEQRVTVTFSEAVAAGSPGKLDSWSVEGAATISTANYQNDSNSLSLTMLDAITAPVVLTYSGSQLSNAGGESLKYRRLIIGTNENQFLDGSGYGEDNVAIFSNGVGSQMKGGAGSDMLVAGSGTDVMTGGRGADTFVWRTAAGAVGGRQDTIMDFSRDEGDRIDLSGLLANLDRTQMARAFNISRVSADSNDTLLRVDLEQNDDFTLSNTTVAIRMVNTWDQLQNLNLDQLIAQDIIRV